MAALKVEEENKVDYFVDVQIEDTRIYMKLSNSKNDLVGTVEGYLVNENQIKKQDPSFVQEAFDICKQVEKLTHFSLDPMATKMLLISKFSFDEKYSDIIILSMLKEALLKMVPNFTTAVVTDPNVVEKKRTLASNLLATQLKMFLIWNRLGFEEFSRTKFYVHSFPEARLKTFSSFTLTQPFLIPVGLAFQVEKEEGYSTFKQVIRRTFDQCGTKQNPSLFEQCTYVMDEWGYLGKILLRTDKNTVVYWGESWEREVFDDNDMISKASRPIVPCQPGCLFNKRTSAKAFQNNHNEILERENIKRFRKGKGWKE